MSTPNSLAQDGSSQIKPTAVSRKFITLEIKYGSLIIELYPDKAPGHVKRIEELCQEKFYDGLFFHRAIPGFMVQTGDPLGNGTGGSKKPNLQAEFNDIPHDKGVLSMARSSSPNSANSQFFIMLDRHEYLDHNYTAFGKVLLGISKSGERSDGVDLIQQLKMGTSGNNGAVSNPDKIERMYIGLPEGFDPGALGVTELSSDQQHDEQFGDSLA